MTKIQFEREVRTSASECYTLFKESGEFAGRLDIHLTEDTVHCTLFVEKTLTEDDIKGVINDMETALLNSLGITMESLTVHVHRGEDLGVYSPDISPNSNGGNYQLN